MELQGPKIVTSRSNVGKIGFLHHLSLFVFRGSTCFQLHLSWNICTHNSLSIIIILQLENDFLSKFVFLNFPLIPKIQLGTQNLASLWIKRFPRRTKIHKTNKIQFTYNSIHIWEGMCATYHLWISRDVCVRAWPRSSGCLSSWWHRPTLSLKTEGYTH